MPQVQILSSQSLILSLFQPIYYLLEIFCYSPKVILEVRKSLVSAPIINSINYILREDSMQISMYQATIPVLVRSLNNLAAILEKGAAHAEAKKIDPAVLISSRLYPDMFPLGKQVQIASDVAKRGAARLADVEPPAFADTETTFPELIDRLQKTIAYLNTLTPEQFDGSEEKAIDLPVGAETMTFQGMPFLLYFIHPNLYFHVTTTYDILRHNGVELGKMDFLGKPS